MSNRLETRVLAKDASFTVVFPFHAPGTLFTNRGATGTVTATLPTASLAVKGCWYTFRVHANFSLVVAAAAANTLLTLGDVAADNVGFQIAGKKIGRGIMAYCDGVQWHAYPLGSGDGFCIDGSEFGPTSSTFTTPTLVAPNGALSTGLMICKSVRFVEAAAGTSYTGTVPIPAGAVLHDVKVIAEVLWNGTTATMKVGDTADDDGFFTGINLKATDLLVNEVLSAMHSTLWGGKEGAYLVAASGRRGPTATNFGMYYAAGSNITGIVTPGAADGTAGRTVLSVIYSVGEALAPVVV